MAGLIRRFDGGRFAASRFNGQRKGERAPEVITADTAPQLAAADDTDTPEDVFTAGSYSSTAGTIDSAVATYLVNGSSEASSYDLEAGDTLQVRELVTDSAGNSRTFSTGLATVALSEALSNTTPPEIIGTTAVGNTLSASQGTWAGSAPRTYSYQWTRDGADIPGADQSTYALVAADEGAEIGVEVMADDGFTTVSASAVAVTVGAEIALPGDVIITSDATSGVAPAAFIFRATNINEDAARNWDFYWESDEQGSYRHLRDGHPFADKKGTAILPDAAFAFETPGTHTVTLTIWDGLGDYEAEKVVKTITVDVADPDEYFANEDTYYISFDGDFSEAPVGANTYTDFDMAASAADSSGTGRLRFRGGEEFVLTAEDQRLRGGEIYFDSFGTGRAIVKPQAPNELGIWFTDEIDVTFTNLQMDNGWDATTETGDDWTGLYLAGVGKAVIHNITSSGMGLPLYCIDADTVIMSDSYITNWRRFGSFFQDAVSGALIGMAIRHDVDALGGGHSDSVGGGGRGFGNVHGPVRVDTADRMVINHFDGFNNTGWSFQVKDGVSRPAHQPHLRWLSSGNADTVASLCMSQFVTEGGCPMLSLETSAGVGTEFDSNTRNLVDSAYLIGTANTQHFIQCSFPGTMVRNTVLVRPPVPSEGLFLQFIKASDGQANLGTGDLSRWMEFYNNTYVYLGDPDIGSHDSFDWFDQDSFDSFGFTNVTDENNVLWAPGLPTPVNDDGALDTTKLFDVFYKGLRWIDPDGLLDDQPTLDTVYASPTDLAASYAPLSGSAALGGATSGKVALRDITGALRGASPSRGAYQDAAEVVATTFSGGPADPLYFTFPAWPDGTTKMTARWQGLNLSSVNDGNNNYLLTSGGSQIMLYQSEASSQLVLVVNFTGEIVHNGGTGIFLSKDVDHDLVISVDPLNSVTHITIDGTTTEVPMTTPASATQFQNNRYNSVFSFDSGTGLSDYSCKRFDIWYDVASDADSGGVPSGAAAYTITGPQATAEASPYAITS